MTRNPLIGTWRLVSWENISADGEVTYPGGQDAMGYIMYTEDGYMSVRIMRPNRPYFAAGDPQRGSTEERAAAAESYFSYCRRYECDGSRVIHHVEMSLFPNWTGVEQERFAELNGNRIILSAKPALRDGSLRTGRLIWERVGT